MIVDLNTTAGWIAALPLIVIVLLGLLGVMATW